jgi:hypothetical protein
MNPDRHLHGNAATRGPHSPAVIGAGAQVLGGWLAASALVADVEGGTPSVRAQSVS